MEQNFGTKTLMYKRKKCKIWKQSLVQNKFFIPTLLHLFKSIRYKTRDGWQFCK